MTNIITFNFDDYQINEKFKDKILEFESEIENSKNPFMFYDTDADGSLSYIQLKKRWDKINGMALDKAYSKIKKEIEDVDFSKHDLIIFFDIPFIEKDLLEKLKGKKIIWADHHLFKDRFLLEEYNINYLNPLDFDEKDNRPSCFIAYLISRNIQNLPFVTLGSVCDFFLLNVILKLYEYNKEEFKVIFPKLEDKKRKEIFDFILKYDFRDENFSNKRGEYINYLSYFGGLIELKYFFDFLYKKEDYSLRKRVIEKVFKYNSLKELKIDLNSQKEKDFEFYYEYKEDFEKIYDDFRKKAKIDKFCFYEYIYQESYTRQISEKAMAENPNIQVLGICFKKPDKPFRSCSFRSRKIILNEFLTNIMKKYDGFGGGHKFACGLNISEKDYYYFKKDFFDFVNSKIN
jgi:hypothetical protein